MIMEKLEEVLKALELCKADVVKTDKGNRAAATRLRKDVGAVAKLLKELRVAALDAVKEAKSSKE
jgi:hypothetical protein